MLQDFSLSAACAPVAPQNPPKVGDRVRGLPGSSYRPYGVGVVTAILPYTSGTGYGSLPAMEVAWETPYIPNPKKPRVAVERSVVNCHLFAVVEAAKPVDEPATVAAAPVVEVAPAASVAIGERVRSTTNGKTGHVIEIGIVAFGRPYVAVSWESGGKGNVDAADLVPAPGILPAHGTLVELSCDAYPRAAVERAMQKLVRERFVLVNLSETGRKAGVAASTLSGWKRRGKVPAERLNQLAEILEIDAGEVEVEVRCAAQTVESEVLPQNPQAAENAQAAPEPRRRAHLTLVPPLPKAEPKPEPEKPVSNVVPIFSAGEMMRQGWLAQLDAIKRESKAVQERLRAMIAESEQLRVKRAAEHEAFMARVRRWELEDMALAMAEGRMPLEAGAL